MSNAKINIKDLTSIKMVASGEKRITKVIRGGMVKEWVGIGWIDLRPATSRDRQRYPEVKETT